MDGFVLAGTESGVGKTVATLVTIRALEATGLSVQPAEAGPDSIDPSHHAVVAGKPSRTLDSWLEGDDGMRRSYHRETGDICVVEGDSYEMAGVLPATVTCTTGTRHSTTSNSAHRPTR